METTKCSEHKVLETEVRLTVCVEKTAFEVDEFR